MQLGVQQLQISGEIQAKLRNIETLHDALSNFACQFKEQLL